MEIKFSMAISTELSVFTSLNSVSGCSLYPFASKSVCFFRPRKFCKGLRMIRAEKDSASEFVQVIGIGSRKDSVLDFCLDSPLHSSSSLRFWNILVKDSLNVQLQQRFLEKDHAPKLVEASLFLQSCPKAIILVASAGYGSDHVIAIDILKTIRSANGFVVAIILKPFSFEGKRRQDEVKDLLEKLQEHTNFCIDIDTDALLKKDLVTLNEALKTANSAVLLAINAISVLISEIHRKLFDVPQNSVKELKVSEAIKILESYKEAKVGFGAGYNIKSSILQAIYDCPFIGAGVKDLNGIVICIVASSGLMSNSDLHAFLHTFRQTTGYTKELVISTIHEPNLEPNLLVTTVVIVGCLEQQASQKSTIFSRLAQHFPFVFNLLRTYHQQSNDTQGNNVFENASLSEVTNSPDSGEMANGLAVEGITEGFDNYSEEFQRVFSSNDNDINASWTRNSESEQSEVGSSEARTESSNFYDQLSEGTPAFHREPLNSWNLGPGYQIAQEWAKERATDSRGTPMHDNLSIFRLPVGVRPSEELKDGVNISYAAQHQEPKTEDDVKVQLLVNSSMSSWGALTDAGFEAMRGFYDTASTLIKKKHNDVPKKQGLLSARAASMLEAERDSPKKWNPIVEMQYRGGVFRGRCQGGLPEGKGRLILGDGSIYDGTWRYGKRSGLGTFYFGNGDVFQGSWRDDVMHGKGWFYFHTGDRWFANFWKGKADGEGRFYSKSGDVFFGQFQDGWRHGHFLCIDVDGARSIEIWDEGVLLSRNQMDADTSVE